MPLLLGGVSCVSGQPFVGGVSLAAPTNPEVGSGFAPGSRIVIQGLNLGEQPAVRIRPVDGAWVGVSIQEATASTIVTVVPRDLDIGPAQLEVAVEDQVSKPYPLWIAERRFVLFTREGGGYGPAVAGHGQALNRFDSPARPGERISLLGIGLGRSSAKVKVLIGGRAIEPDFVGPSAAIAGVDHIDFTLPWDSPEGCLVPFAIDVAGQELNWPYTLSVARSGGHCLGELPLGEKFWEKVDRGERARVAVLSIETPGAGESYAVAWQADYSAGEFSALLSGDVLTRPAPVFCTLTNVYGNVYFLPPPGRFSSIFTGASLMMAPPVAAVSGADGCEWQFTAEPDRRQGAAGPANCAPTRFRFGRSSQPVAVLPVSPIPWFQALWSSGKYSLSWSDNLGPGLLEAGTSLFNPGRGFLPWVQTVKSCSLAAESGQGDVSLLVGSVGWGARKRTVAYRVLEAEPGTDATLVRFVRMQSVPVSAVP